MISFQETTNEKFPYFPHLLIPPWMKTCTALTTKEKTHTQKQVPHPTHPPHRWAAPTLRLKSPWPAALASSNKE